MNLKEAVNILENHNKWIRGDDNFKMADPKKLGEAVDIAVNILKPMSKND